MTHKTCSKCKVSKPTDGFNKNKNSKDGLHSLCRQCHNNGVREFRALNRDHVISQAKLYDKKRSGNQERKDCKKRYRERYKEEIKLRSKKYHLENYDIKLREKSRLYYLSNKHEISKKSRARYLKNRDRYLAANRQRELLKTNTIPGYKEEKQKKRKQYRQKNKEKLKSYSIERRKRDPIYKMTLYIRTRTSTVFRRYHLKKDLKTEDLLGISYNDLFVYIEGKFKTGMNWHNYGKNGWVIDHIIPLSSAKSKEDLIKLSHYLNLQPLWYYENAQKGSKIL